MTTEPRLVGAEDVHRLLDYPFLIEALRRAHLGATPTTDARVMDEPDGVNSFVTLTGWQQEGGIVVKMVGVFPENVSRIPPEPSVQGLVALFGPETGAPRLVADGAAMTFRKTAADSGLGALLLAREDAETLLVVGAGGLAPHLARAHRAARPSIRRTLVWNRTHERAEALAARLSDEGLEAEARRELGPAVAEADVITCATMSEAPLVRGADVRPGAHLDLVGAYRARMREADDAAMAGGRLFVDTRVGMEGTGEIAQPLASGAIAPRDVLADLRELARGAPGRTSPEDLTVFKNVGGAHLDLFAALALLERLDSAR